LKLAMGVVKQLEPAVARACLQAHKALVQYDEHAGAVGSDDLADLDKFMSEWTGHQGVLVALQRVVNHLVVAAAGGAGLDADAWPEWYMRECLGTD
jgi:hypothetical protein